jgi:hypothetical protein
MLKTLSNLFANIFDESFAPPEALTPTHETGVHFATDMTVDWTNGFGTLNDNEVPASSCSADDPFATW